MFECHLWGRILNFKRTNVSAKKFQSPLSSLKHIIERFRVNYDAITEKTFFFLSFLQTLRICVFSRFPEAHAKRYVVFYPVDYVPTLLFVMQHESIVSRGSTETCKVPLLVISKRFLYCVTQTIKVSFRVSIMARAKQL